MNGAKFRGDDSRPGRCRDCQEDPVRPFWSPNSTCWGQGPVLTANVFRADVLSLLPMRMDAADEPTGKRLVNTSNFVANSLPGHTVTLPVRSGNQPPESAGATLVAVYRTLDRNRTLEEGGHLRRVLSPEWSHHAHAAEHSGVLQKGCGCDWQTDAHHRQRPAEQQTGSGSSTNLATNAVPSAAHRSAPGRTRRSTSAGR